MMNRPLLILLLAITLAIPSGSVTSGAVCPTLKPVFQTGPKAVAADGVFEPTSVGTVHIWTDATDANTLYQDAALTSLVTAGGQGVQGWKDKSGRDNHLISAATVFYEGKYAAAALNGLPAVNSNNGIANMDLRTSGNIELDSFTIFVVGKFPATREGLIYEHNDSPHANPGSFLSTFSSLASRVAHGASGGGSYMSDLYPSSGTWFATGSPISIAQNYNRASSLHQVFKNGTEISYSSTTAATEPNQSVNAVFKLGQRGGSGFSADGDFGELIVYSPALGDTQRGLVVSYLAAKWGL